jgi:cell division septation protein DedD
VILPVSRPVRALTALLPLAGLALAAPRPVQAQSLFQAQELDQSRFVVVAAPIGDGSRAQLNIYEQRSNARPCFAVQGEKPGVVSPLLATFDFTGICNRYIDANGYSVRVGGTDLATVYRLSVVRQGNDNQLLAIPTKAGAGPEMVVARSSGQAAGFLLLVPEPGWKLMRRSFSGRALGHVYVYRDTWPEAATAGGATTAKPVPVTPAAATPVPAAPAMPAAATVKPVAPSAPAAPAKSAPLKPATPPLPPSR